MKMSIKWGYRTKTSKKASISVWPNHSHPAQSLSSLRKKFITFSLGSWLAALPSHGNVWWDPKNHKRNTCNCSQMLGLPHVNRAAVCVHTYTLSCIWLFETPGSSVHRILQARILEWVAISSSRGSSQSRDRTCVSYIGRRILYHQVTWKSSNWVST